MNKIKLKNGLEVSLNWVPSFKPSHYDFISTADKRGVKDSYYSNSKCLDQGTEGACTGFGSAHIADHYFPDDERISNQLGLDIYHEAQFDDGIPGENYEGTTSDAALKILKKKGYITEYKWHLTFWDFLISCCHDGPIGAGLPWFEGMIEPDEEGHIHVTGKNIGGHFVEIVGYDVTNERFRIHNSWGRDWSILGADCWISLADMEKVWANGETSIPTAAEKAPEIDESDVEPEKELSFWDWLKGFFS